MARIICLDENNTPVSLTDIAAWGGVGGGLAPGDYLFQINSVEQKQIGKSFLFFKGTYTEKEAIMLTSDRNIHDELDKSKPEVIRDYTSRMGFSKIRSQHYFSTPTIPDVGIDALWGKSDQKHWRFDCPHCQYEQHMEWEKNVDRERKIYVCQKCRNKIIA